MVDYIKIGCKDNCLILDENEIKNAPNITNNKKNKDCNNGLITSIWGPPTWESFHSITFGYPINPSKQQQKDYMDYFRLLGKVLPCKYCRDSYDKFVKKGITKLDLKVMKSRETLTKWGFELHNKVNRKLGVEYGETYEEMCYKFESYRAKCTKVEKGCLMPLDMKAMSYQKSKIHRAPIIDVKYCIALINHADTLGLKNYKKFINFYRKTKRNSKDWTCRDYACRKIISYMRQNGINSLDENNLPTEMEMILISMLCSTLCEDKLIEISEIMENNSSEYNTDNSSDN
jgi:hypothetical protein